MGITFDHVEGVVQKASEPTAAPQSEAGEAPQKSPQDSFEEARRRMDRMARRLHAD